MSRNCLVGLWSVTIGLQKGSRRVILRASFDAQGRERVSSFDAQGRTIVFHKDKILLEALELERGRSLIK